MFETIQQTSSSTYLTPRKLDSAILWLSLGLSYTFNMPSSLQKARNEEKIPLQYVTLKNQILDYTALILCRSFERIENEPAASVASPKALSAFSVFCSSNFSQIIKSPAFMLVDTAA